MNFRSLLIFAFLALVNTAHAQTFDDWRGLNFSAGELADPLVSGADADPSGGGVKNLLGYALEIDPHSPDISKLPAVGFDGGHMTLSFTVEKNSMDLIYTPEVTSDLTAGWSSGGGVTGVAGFTDEGSSLRVTVFDRAYAAGNARRFIRLRVSLGVSGAILPAWWQLLYFNSLDVDPNALALRGDGLTNLEAFQQGLNPNDYYNGQTPVLAKAGGDAQTGNPNGFVPQPLIVSVKDSAGNALSNAPIAFAVTSGGGTLQASSSGTAASTITVNADGDGMAKVYFKLPNTQNATCQVTATAGTGNNAAQVAFIESSDDGSGSFASPFAPSNVVATYNSDGSVDVSWSSNNDTGGQTPTPIQYKDADGNWVTFATAPAGSTSYHVPAQ
jgi:hypothetical protein